MEMRDVQGIQNRSTKKLVLYYLRMKKSPTGLKSICAFVAHKKQRPSRIKDYLKSLAKDGLVEEYEKDSWLITPKGIRAVLLIGKRDKCNTMD